MKKLIIPLLIILLLSIIAFAACDTGASEKLTATYDGSHTVYVGDDLDSIKPYLTVTYTDKQGTETTVQNYTLSGTLNKGNSTVTVKYNGITCTVTINVKEQTIIEPTEYTIIFNSNGGSEVESITNILNGSNITEPAEPTKEMAEFLGWYRDSNFNTKWNFATDKVTYSLTLYAKWLDYTQGLEYTLNSDNNSYSVTGIGSASASREIAIPSVYNGKPVTAIDSRAFYNCNDLTSITIPDSVTTIGEYAFYYCTSITSVTIPSSVTTIGEYAFYGCFKLSKVNYWGAIEDWCNISFGSGASNPLSNTVNLYLNDELVTELIIPDTVKEIKDFTFSNCTSITSVTIPDSVTSIGENAFYGCINLTSVIIGNSVTTIYSWAFRNCSKLISVIIPDSVTTIGSDAFSNCSKLQYNEYSDALYLGNASNPYLALIKAKNKYITNCIINNNTKFIDNNAFSNCSNLTSITIGNSVTSIRSYAFYDCDKLSEIRYNGTVSEWNAITKGLFWNDGVPATKVICSDGEVTL